MIKEWLKNRLATNVVQTIGIMTALIVMAYLIGLVSLSIMLMLYGFVYHGG